MVQGLSTYISYHLIAGDLTKSLSRVASDAQVKRDAAYYDENIGKVTSVDDFMKNSRLYNYAMKAYGLEDMAYAKAFMKKVFTSDQNDSKSFVRKLTDPRFLKIAQAFNFGTDGKVKESPATAQETSDIDDTADLYSDRHIKQGTTAATEANYYQAIIGNVTDVDDFLSRSRLVSFAEQAFGLDTNLSKDTLKAILTSDPSDPDSFANQSGKGAYMALASAYNFNTDGSISGGTAQPAGNVKLMVYAYYDSTGTGSTAPAAAFKTQYYKDNISSITNVDDFLDNEPLLDYALTAYGLDPALQGAAKLRQVLTSDLSDPTSFANQQSAALKAFAAAFNFDTDGEIKSGSDVQSTTQINATAGKYLTTYDDATEAADTKATTNYKTAIASIGTVSDLLKNKSLYNYVLSAYGLDPTTESKLTITKVLESDPDNPLSFANTSGKSAYKALAAAFNFDSSGTAQTASAAQVNASVVSTITAYNAAVSDPKALQATTKAESNYYANTIGGVQNVDELLKDKRLVAYLQKAYGLGDAPISSDILKKALTSDPLDPKSFVNQKGNDKYRPLATAFNFDAKGNVSPVAKLQSQDKSDKVATADLYLRQTLEENAGSESDGVRLALYFQRVAPNVTSAYGILADKALLQVTQTALGLPTSMSNADIDIQANMITKKLNIADLKDPKKLEKFIARFASLYDVNNSGFNSSAGSIATQLISAIR